MTQPFTFYDASGAVDAADQATTSAVLGDLNRNGTEASLDHALGQLNDLVAELSAKDRSEGVSPDFARLLEEITGENGAPLAWASLQRRVEAGVTTWDSFWAEPAAEDEGMRLVFETMTRSRLRLAQGLAAAREGRAYAQT